MIFEETEYFDLKQEEANICVYLGFAIIYVVQRLFMHVSNKRRFPGRHHNSIHRLLISFVQTVSTSRVSIVFSRYFEELVPHLFTEQSLGPNVSVISKKRKRKTRTVFSRFNSLFCPFFFKETENF